jgi:capsid portal protein
MSKKRVPVAKSTADLRSSAVAANASRDEILKAMTFTAREQSAVAPAPDEADQVWMGVGAVIPPYEPFVLLTLLEHSNSLRQCIDAYVTNIDAFGHRFDPVIDLTASDADDRIKQYIKSREAEKNPGVVADPTRQVPEPGEDQVSKVRAELIERMREELLQIQHFFEYACLNESFVSLRRKTRQDIETMGNAYWECIKSTDGKLAGFEYVPGFTVRHMPADRHATTVQMKVKKDLFNYTEIEGKRHFRRFVQVFETRTIWFKEFGDPRVVSRKDGAYFAKVEDLKKRDTNDEPASEIFHFSVHSSKSSYGIPRWIGTILSVLGSRQAEEVNHSYFENKSVPPLAVLVSGGRISQSTVDRIKEFIENDIKGKKKLPQDPRPRSGEPRHIWLRPGPDEDRPQAADGRAAQRRALPDVRPEQHRQGRDGVPSAAHAAR